MIATPLLKHCSYKIPIVSSRNGFYYRKIGDIVISHFLVSPLYLNMGGVLDKDGSPEASAPKTKLEAKIFEAVRTREVQGSSMTAFNSIILKFPKIDESFRKCRSTFEEFDEDGNGSIDPEELKHCFHKLEINFTDEEIDDLFEECDINKDMRIKFNEFIVLLCLVYLLKKVPAVQHSKSQVGMHNLKTTFETLVDAFVFLDKNKDGYVSKSEMVEAINETNSGERSSGRIAMKRFEEMDWDKNGTVNFKEFLFAFTRWVGIDDNDDDEEDADDDKEDMDV
ncbi:Calcium-binding EF-hand family protein [Perilla frutescens var. hirtella]|nr:Calcium-binding EF-hand family protein [Perilla frutescens var. hirtella]